MKDGAFLQITADQLAWQHQPRSGRRSGRPGRVFSNWTTDIQILFYQQQIYSAYSVDLPFPVDQSIAWRRAMEHLASLHLSDCMPGGVISRTVRLHSNTLLLGLFLSSRPAGLDSLMKHFERIVFSIEVTGQSLQRQGVVSNKSVRRAASCGLPCSECAWREASVSPGQDEFLEKSKVRRKSMRLKNFSMSCPINPNHATWLTLHDNWWIWYQNDCVM